MSHLPDPTLTLLKALVCGVEERLQADGHKVGAAMAEHSAFDARYVESPLVRSLIVWSARQLADKRLDLRELTNGGVIVSHVQDETEWRFRLRRAERDAKGELVVTVSSDSVLTNKARELTLFDAEGGEGSAEDVEHWVLAYEMNRGTRTFQKVSAARIVGVIGERSPYRLRLADVVPIPHTLPLPDDFKTDRDDLDLPDEDEERGEEAE